MLICFLSRISNIRNRFTNLIFPFQDIKTDVILYIGDHMNLNKKNSYLLRPISNSSPEVTVLILFFMGPPPELPCGQYKQKNERVDIS